MSDERHALVLPNTVIHGRKSQTFFQGGPRLSRDESWMNALTLSDERHALVFINENIVDCDGNRISRQRVLMQTKRKSLTKSVPSVILFHLTDTVWLFIFRKVFDF